MTFLVCGEALYDVFVGAPTPTGFALDARIGGSAFNVAVGMARLGMPAGLFAGVGTDALGDGLAAALAAEGVDPALLRRKALRTTLALVALGADGGARYSFYGENAADRALTEADLPPLDGVRALMFGCLSLLTEPTGSSYLALARRARALGPGRPLITLDPNIRPTVEPDMDVWRARVAAFAACADLVKLSAEDLSALHPGVDPAEAARAFLDSGVKLVALTRGGEGATIWGRFGEVRMPAPEVAVVDTVGAGDSFLAALIAALAADGRATPAGLAALDAPRARAALGFAVRAAALTCARRGADLPRRAEVGAGEGEA
ncbi:PfkB family carbohydrate kinase [Rubrimonas sp.]|uniref:PfkB family carbohydrate kinase n=1 Tax=Rubrimonas sp. TaxID=2036015 RepID=UPI002FDE2E22